ncbi:hypothetical protein [Rhizobium sp. OAE497]|jgi:ElaB/YqjD/DUF883 family membrane-anchored ribosome-binding protein|uniref:hypothetical protein n=1 Tax=unclassified Rhizobium TaxID=2613769 RepID=UPI000DD887E1
MADPKDSPAVQSLLREQAAQRSRSQKGELDRALEDTFPASDPVSASTTSIPTGRADAGEAARGLEADESSSSEPADRSLRRDAGQVRQAASQVAKDGARAARAEARSVWADVEATVRENPLTAVGIVAAVAYLWGATR